MKKNIFLTLLGMLFVSRLVFAGVNVPGDPILTHISFVIRTYDTKDVKPTKSVKAVLDITSDQVTEGTVSRFIQKLNTASSGKELRWISMKAVQRAENKQDLNEFFLARAAKQGSRRIVSYLVETKGLVPSGQALRFALELATQRGHERVIGYLLTKFGDKLKKYERGIYYACGRVNDIYRNPLKWIFVSLMLEYWHRYGWKWGASVESFYKEEPFHHFILGTYFRLHRA